METKARYKKMFIMLNEEERGFGLASGCSGYVKIEVVEGRGKLLASVQGLKEDSSDFVYKLYMLKCCEEQLAAVCVGNISMKKNRGELKWEFNPSSFGSTGISLNDFNVASVVVEYKNRQNSEIICPLAGYTDKKISWMDKFQQVIYPSSRKIEMEQDVFSKYSVDIKRPYVISQSNEEVLSKDREQDNSVDNGAIEQQSDVYYERIRGIREFEPEEVETNIDIEDITESIKESLNRAYSEAEQYAPNQTNNAYAPQTYAPQTNYTPQYMPYYLNVPPNQGEQEDKNISKVEKLKSNLSKHFVSCGPFCNGRSDYEWWNVNSPVDLNNIMYMSNIKTPLLFNPEVMTSHFKYRHLIVGIYTNKDKQKQYMVCGIPGVYGTDARPFGQMGVWVQREGNNPTFGAFGYWLVYVDPENGRILNVS